MIWGYPGYPNLPKAPYIYKRAGLFIILMPSRLPFTWHGHFLDCLQLQVDDVSWMWFKFIDLQSWMASDPPEVDDGNIYIQSEVFFVFLVNNSDHGFFFKRQQFLCAFFITSIEDDLLVPVFLGSSCHEETTARRSLGEPGSQLRPTPQPGSCKVDVPSTELSANQPTNQATGI